MAESLDFSICQFLWCKYSHYGKFRVNDLMSLNTELGGASSIQHTISESPSELWTLLSQSDLVALMSELTRIRNT